MIEIDHWSKIHRRLTRLVRWRRQVGMGPNGESMQVMVGGEVFLELVVTEFSMEALGDFFSKLAK